MSTKLVARGEQLLWLPLEERFRGVAPTEEGGCFCCALECVATLEFSVEFCDMVLSDVIAIPNTGIIFDLGTRQDLPIGWYMFAIVGIVCTPCGWEVSIGVCAGCGDEQTTQFSNDTWAATVPFAQAEETPGAGHCPELGAVSLRCFGEQFGIPCNASVTASIL